MVLESNERIWRVCERMKKDDVIIMSCSVCGGMSHAIKNPQIPESYRVKESEYVICKICFGLLK